MALPNLAALRLGHGPELNTAGHASTFLGAIAARARQSLYANPASGKEECAVSLEKFEDGDPIWIGESGHYYHPWVYFRSYKTNGRDPCGSVRITAAEGRLVERELWRIVAAGLREDATERQKWAAEETKNVLRVTGVEVGGRGRAIRGEPEPEPEPYGFDRDEGFDPHPGEMMSIDELEHAVGLEEGRGFVEGNYARQGFRGENYTHAELEMLRVMLDMDPNTSSIFVPITQSSRLRHFHPGSNFLWTNPLAGGRLDIRWQAEFDFQPDGTFGRKASAFVLNLQLGENKVFSNLLLALASPSWRLLERGPNNWGTDWHLGARGSLLTLKSVVLKALLIGARRDRPPPLTDAQIDTLANRLDGRDFYVTFSEQHSRRPSMMGHVTPAQLGVTVSAALMSHLLAPEFPSVLQDRVAAQHVPYPAASIPSPEVSQGWGDLDDPHSNGLPPGWEDGSSTTRPLRDRVNRNWTTGADRMMQLVHNLGMLTMRTHPDRYLVLQSGVIQENWANGAPQIVHRERGQEHGVVHYQEVNPAFWYALDAYHVDVDARVELPDGRRIAQVNGRAGVYAPDSA